MLTALNATAPRTPDITAAYKAANEYNRESSALGAGHGVSEKGSQEFLREVGRNRQP